jgi:diguanylate cyclase (GGDEF)-like protein
VKHGADDLSLVREQLDSLLKQAHTNQQKMRLFSEQELLMIGITSLPELLNHLLYRLPEAFGLDTVSLLLIDSDYELSRLLAHEANSSLHVPALMIDADDARVRQLYLNTALPQLSLYRADLHQLLFHDPSPPQSVALLPLVRSGRMIGSLHFGSSNPQRFNSDSATDFLQHLAVIAAVCLENCINHARLKQIGLTDPLTGVSNRRYFEQRIIEACATAQRHQRPLSALFVDVDHFKRINDTWGHPAGDAVLRSIAQLIAGHLRHSDVLCRYGGEEFVILLPDTAVRAACEIAERIRQTIAAEPQEIPAMVTVSVGVAALESFGEEALTAMSQRLLASADAALYRAKQQGRDQVVVAEEG